MVSGGNKRMKVVWICHFVSKDIIEHFNDKQINPFAPWINGLIKIFEKNEDVDLYIVAPNYFINKTYRFKSNNIRYYLFKINYPFSKIKYLNLNILWFGKKNVHQIIDSIKPDIIHLHGAENAYYSSTLLPLLNKYPTIVTIQGFVFKSSKKKWLNEIVRLRRIKTEKKILTSAKNFGIRAKFMKETIQSFNPTAKFYWHNYPVNIPIISEKEYKLEKEYDCVFFARLTRDKGIEDLLIAISLVKKIKKDISLIVLGGASDFYFSYLKQKCKKLNIEKNVKFFGFLPQDQLFKTAIQAKISILPTYHDIIPGTVIESMFLKLPVISYNVDGLPDINETGENIILIERADVNGIADWILKLLVNDKLRHEYEMKGYKRAEEMYRNENIYEDLLSIYEEIMAKDSLE